MSIRYPQRFEWDPRKAKANLASHGVRFADAATVLDDEQALTREDPDPIGEHKDFCMKKVAAEPVREIDFSGAKRGRVTPSQPGKTKISIRLDNAVIDHFRDAVEAAGGGNYQSLINEALVAWIQQRSMIDAMRRVVREELAADRRLRPAPRARATAPVSPAPDSPVSRRRAAGRAAPRSR